MRTLTKDIHYLCPSKPFIRDSTDEICGLKPMVVDARCPTTVTPRSQVTSRWLVNTPARTAVLTYDQHDTATRITLPDQTLWITVPENAILHIEDLALYHLSPDQYESEMSEFFSKHTLELDPNTVTQIQYEGTQTIDVTPVDNVLKEIASQSKIPNQPITYAWSTPDTVLAVTVILGYLLTFGIAFFYIKRTQALQCKLDKCNQGLATLWKRPERKKPSTELEKIEEDREYSGQGTPMAPAILKLAF